MVGVAVEPTADAFGALAEGRWGDARAAFEAALAGRETAEACFGLAMALWWLGENHACVEWCSRSYALFRESGEVEGAAQCAVWLAITYKANFANFAAAQRLDQPGGAAARAVGSRGRCMDGCGLPAATG